MINDQGGVNGRKITMISLDDGISPPKTVEQTRQLVEEDQVLAMSGSLGTATNASIQKYLNTKKVPQLFLATGASRWNDPKNFPYTMTLTPIYRRRRASTPPTCMKEVKDPKVAVLYQNDDFGKDFLKGFRERLGDKAGSIIVREVSYEVTDATVNSQIIDLASTKANVFLNISTPKFAVQAIRKAHDLGWKPLQFIDNPAASIGDRHAAGRHRGLQGHRLGGLREGSDRSAVQGRSGIPGLGGVDEEVLSRRQPRGSAERGGLHSGPGHGAGAEAVRRHLTRENVMQPGGQPQGRSIPPCCSRAST